MTSTFSAIYRDETGEDFPEDPAEQLRLAIRAVFDSWSGDRAVSYRRINRIPDEWGTAVNVQQMVFGNKGETSGSGVAFSRDEVTGETSPSGDFLVNAQGEDVVSGVRNTRDIDELAEVMPEAHAQLMDILRTLERHYKDMQDTEFTVEEGRLYMLQTRNAKRPAQAAVRFAVDAVAEGLLTKAQALATIDADKLDALLHPMVDPAAVYAVLVRGVGASPGAASGGIVFTADEAVAAERDVILVRPFTDADDVAGFHAARGIVTSQGGKASHAALVARGMGVPAVTGASGLDIDVDRRLVRVGDVTRDVVDVSPLPPVAVGGPGVSALLAASGVGYGEGFAANHHRFAPGGMLAAVKYLVEELHADVNARDHDGNSAIHNAAARGDNEMILYLVAHGADPKFVNREGKTTVDMANGPVQRISPFPDTIKLLEGMGVKNNHKCVSC
jgi:pyruvate,phosphate dikinase